LPKRPQSKGGKSSKGGGEECIKEFESYFANGVLEEGKWKNRGTIVGVGSKRVDFDAAWFKRGANKDKFLGIWQVA